MQRTIKTTTFFNAIDPEMLYDNSITKTYGNRNIDSEMLYDNSITETCGNRNIDSTIYLT